MAMLIEEAFKFVAKRWSRAHTIIPIYVGESGVGKTARVEAMAAELGLPCQVVLVHSSLEDDLLGWPVLGRSEEKLARRLPDWWPDGPAVVFLDELDKIRPGHAAAILTLITSGRLYGRPLPEGTTIVGAMQPLDDVDEWLSDSAFLALSERSVFFPLSEDWGWVQEKSGIDFSDILPTSETPRLPLKPSPSQRKILWLTQVYAEGVDENVFRALVHGAVSGKYADAVYERIRAAGRVSAASIVETLRRLGPAAVSRLTVPELRAALVDIVVALPPTFFARAVETLADRVDFETLNKVMVETHVGVADRIYAAGGELDIFGGVPEEGVAEALALMCKDLLTILRCRPK